MASVECFFEEEGKFAAVVVEADDDATDPTLQMSSGDDASSFTDDEAELSWRLDPKRSLSDWTVKVVIRGTRQVTVYNVHKSALAVGPRRSGYFSAAFKASRKKQLQMQEHQRLPSRSNSNRSRSRSKDRLDCMSSVGGGSVATALTTIDTGCTQQTRLEVHPLAADAFPVLLDFVYSTMGELNISNDNATALCALANHLEIKALRRAAIEFWQQELAMDNVCVYYQHARIFKDKDILRATERHCAENIFTVPENIVVDILTTVDPLFFLRVVTSESIVMGTTTSLRLSLLVAVYCNIHKVELEASMFLRLTASSVLPALDTKAARALLEIEDDIVGDKGMTSLKTRSIAVLAEHWDIACILPSTGDSTLDDEDEEDPASRVHLPRLQGEALERFSSLALLNAKERLAKAEEERHLLDEENEQLKKDLEALRRCQYIHQPQHMNHGASDSQEIMNISADMEKLQGSFE